MKRFRYKFWLYVHDQLEAAWHWVYYKRVKPLEERPTIIQENRIYHLIETRPSNDPNVKEVRIYGTNA